jgi:membrane protein, antimicrobial resistance system
MSDRSGSRLWRVLVRPAETFAAIAGRPTWGLALAVLVVASAAASVAIFQHVDMLEMVRQQMAAQHQAVPAGIESKAPLFKGCAEAIGAFAPAVFALLAAALFLVFNLLGGTIDYRRSLAVTVHAAMPGVVRAILVVPVALSRAAVTMEEAQGGLLRSNLSFLAPAGAGKPLLALLTSLDLFTLWQLVLLAIGYRVVARVSRATAATTVVLLWALFVAVIVGIAALGAARGAAGAPG